MKPLGVGAAIATGARVSVTVNGLTQVRYAGLAQGHTSQSLTPLHFGLGQASSADVVEITWPGGVTVRLENVRANQTVTVPEPQ